MRVFRAVVLAGAVIAALVVPAVGSGAQGEAPRAVSAVEGRAEGLFVDAETTDGAGAVGASVAVGEASPSGDVGPAVVAQYGPAPLVEVGPESGGPITDALNAIDVASGSFTVRTAEVSTEGATGPDGFARSSARLTDFNLAGIVGAEMTSECEATAEGVSGDTHLTDVRLSTAILPADPAPNTVLTSADLPPLAPGLTLTLNEQHVVSDDDGQHIEVTALHLEAPPGNEANFIGEFYAGRSVCGVELVPPVVEVIPTFTG